MDSSVETGKRVVVSGQWDGGVVPGSVQEMNREVVVRPGSHVTGCIFGRTIRIQGPVDIDRAVYATEELEIALDEGVTRINSSIGCRQTLSFHPGDGRAVVAGDVNARNVRVLDTAVRGSVHGEEARLRRCLVFGAAHGEQRLELEETTALTAYGESIVFGDGCSLILPYARAEKSLDVRDGVQLLGFPAEHGTLTEEDVVRKNGEKKHLTAGRRLTNLGQARGHLENLRNFISRVSLQDVLRSIPDEVGYSEDALPAEVRGWLDDDSLMLESS